MQAIPTEVIEHRCVPVSSREIILGAVPLPRSTSAYHRLRQLEKVYLAGTTISFRLRHDPAFMRLRQWIENPRMYAGFAEANEGDLIATAMRHVASSHLA
jgi:hypothetical protein